MTKKKKKMLLYGGGVIVGLGVLTTIVIVANSGKTQYPMNGGDKGKLPSQNAQVNPTPNTGGGYVPPAPQNANGYSSQDTTSVQKLLYTYYPQTIKKIGDIGTRGVPDGIWGNNTQKVVDSVVAKYGWGGVAQLVEYAKNGWTVYRNELTEGVKGLSGVEILL